MAMLSENYKNMLLHMKPDDFSVSKITELFGYHATRNREANPPLIDCSALVNLKANEYINKKDIQTTAGRLLFNKLLIEGKIDYLLPDGYYNEVVTKKSFDKITDLLADSLVAKKITVEKLCEFLKAFEFYGLKAAPIFGSSFTEKTLKPNPEVIQMRDEILSKKDREDFTVDEIIDTENKLVRAASSAAKGDSGMDLYDSGSRGTFDNDYKNMSIMVGTMLNPETGKTELVRSNYMDGISKEDLAIVANGVTNAAYPRAVLTAVGGYLTKQFYSVFQSISLDKKGTDCGSKFTLTTQLTEDNYKSYEFQYIVEGEKLVELNPETKSKYIGKVIHLRSPMGCKNTKICNACAGNRYYYTEIENVGLTAGRVSNTLMQKQMKKFHNQKLKITEADPNKLLVD